MPEPVKEWILNIVSLIVFITVIEIIIPGGKFKKYIHLVTGTIVVIAIITPLTGLAGKDFSFTEFQIKNAAIIEKSEFDKQKGNVQMNQARQITAAYKRKLTDQIQLQVMQATGTKEKGDIQVDVAINEDYGSDSFGEIIQVKVSLLQKAQGSGGAVEASAHVGNLTAPSENKTAVENAAISPAGGDVRSVKIDPVVIGKQAQSNKASVKQSSDTKASDTVSGGNIDEKTGGLIKAKVSSLLNIPQERVMIN